MYLCAAIRYGRVEDASANRAGKDSHSRYYFALNGPRRRLCADATGKLYRAAAALARSMLPHDGVR
jgi:hypothetical protein